jgi:hypothetical protein
MLCGCVGGRSISLWARGDQGCTKHTPVTVPDNISCSVIRNTGSGDLRFLRRGRCVCSKLSRRVDL